MGRSARALSFGSVASDYERYRRGYPDRVVADVMAYSDFPLTSALEIGAGTGKATRVFARHGIDIAACEPDPAMLAELRRHVPDTVTTMGCAFEDVALGRSYDLVYAAASMHWTEPSRRWDRVAALLRPHGVFASFGSPTRLADPDLEDAVGAATARWIDDDEVPTPSDTTSTLDLPPGGGASPPWPMSELVACGLFSDVRRSTIPVRQTITSQDYIGLLSTVSAYIGLPAADRRDLFRTVAERLPPTVAVIADIDIQLARKT